MTTKPTATIMRRDLPESPLCEMQIMISCTTETAERIVTNLMLNLHKEEIAYVNPDSYRETFAA